MDKLFIGIHTYCFIGEVSSKNDECHSAVLIESHCTEAKKTTVKFEGLKTWCLPLRKKDPFGCIPLNVTDLKHLMKWCIRRVVFHFSIFILRLVKQQLFKFIRKSNGESTIHDISVILKRWLHCLNDVKNRLDSDIITERVVLQSHPLFLRKFPKKR
jgi:hypothetical protein